MVLQEQLDKYKENLPFYATIKKIQNTKEQLEDSKKELKNSRDLLNEKMLELKQITKGK